MSCLVTTTERPDRPTDRPTLEPSRVRIFDVASLSWLENDYDAYLPQASRGSLAGAGPNLYMTFEDDTVAKYVPGPDPGLPSWEEQDGVTVQQWFTLGYTMDYFELLI